MRRRSYHFLAPLFNILVFNFILLPFAGCFSYEDMEISFNKSVNGQIPKLSSKRTSEIALHGILLWVSMGFLLPIGVLTIRMSHSHRAEEGPGKRKGLFYLHVISQVLSVLVATCAAIMSIISFENSFDNNHQRIGLALYAAMWVQAVIGFLRPHTRGNYKRRGTWYFVHWLLGTMMWVVGMINIYTGLNAYRNKTLKSNRLWTILFTAQVSFMTFFYLFQDKWEYMQKQGVILNFLGNVPMSITPPSPTTNQPIITLQTDPTSTTTNTTKQGVLLVPQPCPKRNALMNLFD